MGCASSAPAADAPPPASPPPPRTTQNGVARLRLPTPGSAKSLVPVAQQSSSSSSTRAGAATAAASVVPFQALLVFGSRRAELSAALAEHSGGTCIDLEGLVRLAQERGEDRGSISRLQEAVSRPDSLVPWKLALPLILRRLQSAHAPYILSGFVRTAAHVRELQSSVFGPLGLAVQAGEPAGVADRALANFFLRSDDGAAVALHAAATCDAAEAVAPSGE